MCLLEQIFLKRWKGSLIKIQKYSILWLYKFYKIDCKKLDFNSQLIILSSIMYDKIVIRFKSWEKYILLLIDIYISTIAPTKGMP
jgi:hypothetical protein